MRSDLTPAGTGTGASRLSSVSAVVLADGGTVDAAALNAFRAHLSDVAADVETVIVANGVDDAAFLALKQLVAEIPDCSCYAIADPIDPDAARIFGMESAVSDYVLIVSGDMLVALGEALPPAIDALHQGFDIAIALPRGGAVKATPRTLLERAVYGLLSRLSGFAVSPTPTDMIALSRDASLHILSKPNAELMLKAHTAGRGYPARILADAYNPPAARPPPRSIGRRASKALGLLVSIGAFPVRLVSVVSLAASAISVLYALYVVAVYLLKPDIASGWTTLSLQLAGMMFLFSLALALLSEYVVQIHAATASRRRRLVVRELRSPKTARGTRLNVTDATGAFPFAAGGR